MPGILQINHFVNPLVQELWAVGKPRKKAQMRLWERRKFSVKYEGPAHSWAGPIRKGLAARERGTLGVVGTRRSVFMRTDGGAGKERGEGVRKEEFTAEREDRGRKNSFNLGW